MYVSLAPAAAGALISLTGRSFFDPLAALAVGVWLIASTGLEIRRSGEDLLWPANARCPYDDTAEVHSA
jgi:divalent metal cation (Fe/Co/Zn/Cd) transporter